MENSTGLVAVTGIVIVAVVALTALILYPLELATESSPATTPVIVFRVDATLIIVCMAVVAVVAILALVLWSRSQ